MSQVQWGRVAAYVVIAYGLAWLAVLPLWLKGGLESPLFLPLTVLMMYTPTAAALAVTRFGRDGSLGLKPTVKGMGALVLYSLFGILLAMVINLGALAAGQALGLFHADLTDFSAFRAVIEAKLAAIGRPWPANMPPLGLLVLIQVGVAIVAAPLNAIAAAGEEIGWRGFLLPRLMPLGAIPAVVLSGVVWALWHAPVILLGYNYPDTPPVVALSCMSGMCVALGAVLAWLRLKTQSVWPCAVFHGAINAGAGFYLVLGTAGEKVDLTRATPLGWSGWIIPLGLAVVLAVLIPAARPAAEESASPATV